MKLNRRAAAILLVVGFFLSPPAALSAQSWAADVYAGGTRYDALVGRVSTTNLVGTLRFAPSPLGRFYVSAAAPLDSMATLWGAAGVASSPERFLGSGFSLGADFGADGYGYDARAGNSGSGIAFHALPLVRYRRGFTTLELRGGGHEYLFSFPDTSGSRELLEVSARGALQLPRAALTGDLRWLSAEEGSYPYASAQISVPVSRASFWGWAGKWMADQLDDAEWGFGASLMVPPVGDLWISYRQVASDPLYLGTEQRGWNVGITRALGSAPGPSPRLAPRIASGSVRIRLPQETTGSETGVPSVAGEFSEWKPVAMSSAGDEWVLDLPLTSGVYRFSFVSPAGEWFVPEGFPGRIDDGFGGWVALLVVP